jgi:hypothetical protein
MKLIEEDLSEMATIGSSDKDNFIVVVHPDSSRNNAYFKVGNHKRYTSADKVIRLDFFSPIFYDHKKDGKKLWKLNNKEIKMIMEFMSSQTKIILSVRSFSKVKNEVAVKEFNTNWEQAIYLWNNECGFLNHKDLDIGYPKGCNPNSRLYKDSQFVPFNTVMPNYLELQF